MPGCIVIAPLWPQTTQRAQRRSRLLDVFGPQRITNGATATGFQCEQPEPAQ